MLTTCAIQGCSEPIRTKGFCHKHYQQLLRKQRSATRTPKVKAPKALCTQPGCSQPEHCKGLCQMHYRRVARQGDPAVVLPKGRPRTPGASDHRKLAADEKARRAAERASAPPVPRGRNAPPKGKVLTGAKRPDPRTAEACIHGHLYTPENTYLSSEGTPSCRTCRRNASWRRQGLSLAPGEDAPQRPRGRPRREACDRGHPYLTLEGDRICKFCERINRIQRTYGLSEDALEALLRKYNNACGSCKESFGEESPCVDHDHTCCPGMKSCGKCVRGLLCHPCNQGIGLLGDSLEGVLRAAAYLREYTPDPPTT